MDYLGRMKMKSMLRLRVTMMRMMAWTMDRSPIMGVITISQSPPFSAICHRHRHTGRISIIFIKNYFHYKILPPQAEGGD